MRTGMRRCSAKATRPWKDVFATAESVGGVKYYLLTHGATEMTPLETVKATWSNTNRSTASSLAGSYFAPGRIFPNFGTSTVLVYSSCFFRSAIAS